MDEGGLDAFLAQLLLDKTPGMAPYPPGNHCRLAKHPGCPRHITALTARQDQLRQWAVDGIQAEVLHHNRFIDSSIRGDA